MCIKKNLKVKVRRIPKGKYDFSNEFKKLIIENLKKIENEPKMDFSGIKQIK